MNRPLHDAEYYRRSFYELLPAIYRRKDEVGELERFTHVFAEEIARMRSTADQLWRDHYIETCQDWVIPYLGELVGANLLTGDAAESRRDVLNTIRWRQMKGTLAVLQETAEVLWQGGASVAEMFERLATNQHLQYLRPQSVAWVDVSSPLAISQLSTPFNLAGHTLDLRGPTDFVGRHLHPVVATHLSCSHAFEVMRAEPTALDALRHRFSPSDLDTPLFIGEAMEAVRAEGAVKADAAQPGWEQAPLRNADFALHPDAYFASRSGFTLYEDGIPLCESPVEAAGASLDALSTFGSLRTTRGIVLADPLLHAGLLDGFDVRAMRLLRINTGVSSLVPFDQNYQLDGALGALDTTGGYVLGAPAGDLHESAMLLRIERNGADATFPESEIVLQNRRGAAVLVYVDEFVGLGPGPLFLYVAEDGSTYFARADAGQGPPDLNPDSGQFGALLPIRRSRATQGQVMPRPGLRPASFRKPVFAPLCCWGQALQEPPLAGQVAFDPERGRFVFPAAEVPSGELSVTYSFGRAVGLGAVAATVPETATANVTVGRLLNADHPTIQAAVDALPDGAAALQVVEVVDSATYVESLALAGRIFPGGLVIRAGLGVSPTLRSPGGPALTCDAACQIAQLSVQGLVIEGGAVDVAGDIPSLEFVRVTLDPASCVLDYSPSQPEAQLSARWSIMGETRLGANVVLARLDDCVVQHPQATAEETAGFVAVVTLAALEFHRCTILGELQCDALLLSNALHCGLATLADSNNGCARYSRYDALSDIGRAFRSTTRQPILVATRWSEPGHVQLHPQAATVLLSGAEEGGRMGAHYSAGRGWRADNILRKHDEYAPAGTRPQVVRRPALNRKIWIPKL